MSIVKDLTVALRFSVLFLMVSLCGCLIRPDVDPKPLPGSPNSFTAGPSLLHGNVHGVEVWLPGETTSKLIWRIESREGTPAKGFTVTAGLVPAGFVQTVPSEDQAVHLIKGVKYRIVILVDNWPEDVDPRGTVWAAE